LGWQGQDSTVRVDGLKIDIVLEAAGLIPALSDVKTLS